MLLCLKMSSSSLLYNGNKKQNKNHRILVEVHGEYALAARMCQKGLTRFKSGDFGLQDGSLKSLRIRNRKNY